MGEDCEGLIAATDAKPYAEVPTSACGRHAVQEISAAPATCELRLHVDDYIRSIEAVDELTKRGGTFVPVPNQLCVVTLR
jgi:hypothetical protein